jgi:hypothetical protein
LNPENAKLADDLRQQMKRKAYLVFGLSFAGLGMPLAAAYLALVFFIRLSLLYAAGLGVAFVLLAIMASFGLAQLQQGRIQRSLALIAVADELGLGFQEVVAPDFVDELRHLEMFSTANGIAASNVLSGQFEGLPVTAMNCIVSAGQATFENTVFVLQDVLSRVPDFSLTPRDFLSRGTVSVEIPNEPEFNKRFLLRGQNPALLRKVFTRSVIDLCLANRDQSVEVRQPLFVIRQRGKLLPPAQYQPFLLNCVRLAKALGVSARS